MAHKQKKTLWERVDPGTIIALIALILTQTPSIGQMLDMLWPSRVDVNVPQVSIGHFLGQSGISIVFSLRNTGGRDVTIDGVNGVACFVSGPGDLAMKLGAMSYYSAEMPGLQKAISHFSIRRGDSWDGMINFQEVISEDEQAKMTEIISKIQGAVPTPMQYGPPPFVAIDAPTVQAAQQLAKSDFRWRAGNYRLFVQIKSDAGREVGFAAYAFTLAPSAVNGMLAATDEYSKGILFSPRPTDHPFVTITRVDQSSAESTFRALLESIQITKSAQNR